MANLGLLGAVAGVGQALQTFGGDLVKRREQALENARKDAEEQRKNAQRMTEIKTTHDLDMEEIDARETAANTRTDKEITARSEENKAARAERATEKATDRSFRSTEAAKERAGRAELARLNSSLQGARTAAEVNLREQLSADDVQSVQYGAPDANGYAPVFVVTKNGTVKPTGKKVYHPDKAEDTGQAL